MSEPVLYEKWLGPVWLNKHDRCQSDGQCARVAEHEGVHADISLSGIVLRVWDQPELSDDEREVIERINQVRDDLCDAVDQAERELEHVSRDKLVKANPGLSQLVRESLRNIHMDPESMGLPDDKTTWGSHINDLKEAADQRGRRVS